MSEIKQETTAVLAEEIRVVRTYRILSHYPQAHFLSNGNYTVMLTQMGTGYFNVPRLFDKPLGKRCS